MYSIVADDMPQARLQLEERFERYLDAELPMSAIRSIVASDTQVVNYGLGRALVELITHILANFKKQSGVCK